MKHEDTGWKAVARGKRYCAPRCGRGCTMAEYRRAVADGDILARELGAGWRGVVWENLGWHSKAEHPAAGIELRRYHSGRCWATTAITPRYPVQLQGEGTTPAAALRALMDNAVALAKMGADILHELRSNLT